MRSSCREGGVVGLLGYFRGAREFFPQGSFEEPNITVTPDAAVWSTTGMIEVRAEIGVLGRKLRDVEKRQTYVKDSLADKSAWYPLSPEMRQQYRQELRVLSGKTAEINGQLEELRAMIG